MEVLSGIDGTLLAGIGMLIFYCITGNTCQKKKRSYIIVTLGFGELREG